MEFVIETLEEVAPKHPCSSKPARAVAPLPYGGCGMLPY